MPSVRDLKIERPSGTLTDKVTEALTRLIRDGEYAPQARLPSEKEMSERFGVSRTVVREAVSRLKSEGLVESHQGKGAFVRDASPDMPFRIEQSAAESVRSILQLVELRKGLETEAAALAAERRREGDVREIERAFHAVERAVDASHGGIEADKAFHRSIARATGNPYFLALWDFLGQFLTNAMRVTRAYEAQRHELMTQVRSEHQAIVDAIVRRDPEAARSAARHHLEQVALRITSADRGFWRDAIQARPGAGGASTPAGPDRGPRRGRTPRGA